VHSASHLSQNGAQWQSPTHAMWRPKAPHDIFQVEKVLFAEENIAPGTGWDAEIDWCLSSAKA
jgi:hypothetical protein